MAISCFKKHSRKTLIALLLAVCCFSHSYII